jgi:phage gp16-like protein
MKATPAQQARAREIVLIHVGRRELQLDDETYRAMLKEVAGVESSKDLDAQGRKKVLEHMKTKGFKVKSTAASKPGKNEDNPQYRKIQALWSELHRAGAVQTNTAAAIRVYIKRITSTADFAFCSNAQVTVIIETLKKWRDRVASAPADPAAATTASEADHG